MDGGWPAISSLPPTQPRLAGLAHGSGIGADAGGVRRGEWKGLEEQNAFVPPSLSHHCLVTGGQDCLSSLNAA